MRRSKSRREQGERGFEDVIPQAREVPDSCEPFTQEQRKTINDYTESFHHYSKALYNSSYDANHNNSSGFETWRRLHITYDQRERAQQLNVLSRIMKPAWNNTTQQPCKRIYTSILELAATSNRTSYSTRRRSYEGRGLLQTTGTSTLTTTTLLEYMGSKENTEMAKGKGDYKTQNFLTKGKGYTNNYTSQHKGKENGKYGSRPYQVKGKGFHNNYSGPKGILSYNYSKGKSKGKGSKNKSTFDKIPPPPQNKGKGSTKGKGKGTNIICYYCGRPGHTSDKCWWKGPIYNIDQAQQYGHYQTTHQLNVYNNCLLSHQPQQQS
eukprot:4808428-Amphidinium_carterae.1